MQIVNRPSVRVICLDLRGRVLLMNWQDPVDGRSIWEPPGGGIEDGETAYQAACRELTEETGLDPAAIGGEPVEVPRDTIWNGKRFVGSEPFFLARYTVDGPELDRTGLMLDEQANLRGHRWSTAAELDDLPGRLEPPDLARVIATLDPGGPWSHR